jgi:hypothetical protein
MRSPSAIRVALQPHAEIHESRCKTARGFEAPRVIVVLLGRRVTRVAENKRSVPNVFSSDRRIQSYVDVDGKERPDITFFYETCFACRGEGEASNTVVLIEFKRPNRNNYNGNDNPVRQIGDYVEKLKTSNTVTDARGRTAPSRIKGAAYHCYIVADLTDTLLREIRDLNLKITPDGEGRFGYINDGGVYIEIIPYGKLLQDAKLRQGIFFQKLGLTDLNPTAAAEVGALEKVGQLEMSEEIGASMAH